VDKQLPLIILVDGQQVAYDVELSGLDGRRFVTYNSLTMPLDGIRQPTTKQVVSYSCTIEAYGNMRDMTEVWRIETEV
jgi:hypothetical protein